MGYPFPITLSVGTSRIIYGITKSGIYRIPNVIEALEIENLHATQDMYISLDGGINFRTIEHGSVWSIDTYSDRLKRGLLEEIVLYATGAATDGELTLLITEPD